MKGPQLRLKFDIHRRWECPACHARARSPGSVTSMTCPCTSKESSATRMLLMRDGEPMLPFRELIPVASCPTSASEAMANQTGGDQTENAQMAKHPTEEVPPEPADSGAAD